MQQTREGQTADNRADQARGLQYTSMPGDLPTGTICELFLRAIDEFDKPDALLVREDGAWTPVSHRTVLERVRCAAAALAESGVGRGDRAALLSENRPEWAWADYALLCRGALTVPIYSTLPASQIEFIIRDAETELAFVSTAEQLAKMLEVRRAVPVLKTIVTFDETGSTEPGVISFARFLERGQAAGITENEFRVEAARARPEDLATLIYTSGTTGTPKGVMLTHDNLYSNIFASMVALDAGPADAVLSFLPLSHVFQRLCDYLMFGHGTTIAYVSAMDEVGEAFRTVQPTIGVAVPRVYEKLYARILGAGGLKRRLVLWARRVALDWSHRTLAGEPVGTGLALQHRIADALVFRKVRAAVGGRIRFFVSGSAPLSTQIAHFFHGAGMTILEGYGLTETSPVTNVNTPTSYRIGTVGKAVPGTELRIADDGEILVRGRQVMKGYYRNPEATAAVIDADGWFHTGDIGEIDADGYLRITDRKKDLLVTAGGKNIAPQPIQNALKLSRYIAEAVLIGDRRPYPIAVIVPNFASLEAWAREQGIPVSDRETMVAEPRVVALYEEEMQRRVASFARYEMPKKVLVLARELSLENGELTPTLKVRRRAVEDALKDRIEALYAEPRPAHA